MSDVQVQDRADLSGPPRHVLSLSGGKDSAALAVYLRDRVPDMEYIFHDTDKELPETYDYIARLEAILGKPIAFLAYQPLRTISISCRRRRMTTRAR